MIFCHLWFTSPTRHITIALHSDSEADSNSDLFIANHHDPDVRDRCSHLRVQFFLTFAICNDKKWESSHKSNHFNNLFNLSSVFKTREAAKTQGYPRNSSVRETAPPDSEWLLLPDSVIGPSQNTDTITGFSCTKLSRFSKITHR